MRFLLDTHVWLWTLVSPDRIRPQVRSQLRDPSNTLFLSAASSWEIAIKYRIGKLPLPEPPARFIPARLARDGIAALAVEHHHAAALADLPLHHRDPFDRLLLVQARLEQLTLVTADRPLRAYEADLLLV